MTTTTQLQRGYTLNKSCDYLRYNRHYIESVQSLHLPVYTQWIMVFMQLSKSNFKINGNKLIIKIFQNCTINLNSYTHNSIIIIIVIKVKV